MENPICRRGAEEGEMMAKATGDGRYPMDESHCERQLAYDSGGASRDWFYLEAFEWMWRDVGIALCSVSV